MKAYNLGTDWKGRKTGGHLQKANKGLKEVLLLVTKEVELLVTG